MAGKRAASTGPRRSAEELRQIGDEIRRRDGAASQGRWIQSPFVGLSDSKETTWLLAQDTGSRFGAVTITGDMSTDDASLVTALVNAYRDGDLVLRTPGQEP